MSDLISRQAMLDMANGWTYNFCDPEDEWAAMKEIRELPSAEPEIIRCKDCKNSEHWYRDRRRCFLWSEDGVSVFDDGFCNYAERKQDE